MLAASVDLVGAIVGYLMVLLRPSWEASLASVGAPWESFAANIVGNVSGDTLATFFV